MYSQDEIEFKAAMPRDDADVFIRAAYWMIWNDRYGCPQGQPARKVMKCVQDFMDLARKSSSNATGH
jgi:hypothetical protein